MGPALALTVLLNVTASSAVEDAQEAVVRAMLSEPEQDYFKHYCVATNPGTLAKVATREARLQSIQSHPDPPAPLLSRLRRFSSRIEPASACDSAGEDVVYRPTKSKAALLLVLGPLEVVTPHFARITVLSTSGFLGDTVSLVELVRTGSQWSVVSDKVLLQS